MRHTRQNQRKLVASIYADVCEQYTETMVLYAFAAMRGEALPEEFEQFRQHMRICAACTESYQDLLMVLEAEEAEAGMEMVEMPIIPPPWAAQAEADAPAAQEIEHGGFRVWLTQQGNALVHLVVDLSNLGSMTPQVEMRAQSQAEAASAEEFVLDTTALENVQNMELRIAVAVDQMNPMQRELRVELSLPTRWPDFSGAAISLHRATGEVLSQLTGRNGIVKFAGLTLEEIRSARVEVALPPE
jgi:hypothetical protein